MAVCLLEDWSNLAERVKIPIIRVNLVAFKRFVSDEYPLGSTLRELVLHQPDQINAHDFVSRITDWLAILRIEASN